MRIDPNNNLEGIYEANPKKNSKVSENNTGMEKEVKNQDRVEISSAAINYDEINAMKEKVVNEVEKGTSPEKLRQLKAQIENGTYFVNSRDIAGAMLSRNDINGNQDTEDE